jgi:RNA-binding protein
VKILVSEGAVSLKSGKKEVQKFSFLDKDQSHLEFLNNACENSEPFFQRKESGGMKKLEGFERKYLRGLAHGLKPVVLIGQKGLTAQVLESAKEALETHELIKVKFQEVREKEDRAELSKLIEEKTGSEIVGAIGHTIMVYRQQGDPEKRKIRLPKRKVTSEKV